MAGSRFSLEAVVSMIDNVSNPMDKASNSVLGFSKKMQGGFSAANQSSMKMASGMWDFAKTVAVPVVAGLTLAAAATGYFISEASKVENAIAAWTPLLGGVENATAAVKDLNKFAAETPFRFEDLVPAANLLLGFGAATQATLIPTMTMLGDLAMGNADKLKSIALAFGQIKAAGKANLQDINQLINGGVPILAQLAKQWGVTVGQARELIHVKGTAEEIEKAMKTMTSKGGMFFNAMVISSKTFTGVMSTLQDNISMTAAEIGTKMLPFVKHLVLRAGDYIGVARQWVEANGKLINEKVTAFFRGLLNVLRTIRDVIKWIIQFYNDHEVAIKRTIKVISILSTIISIMSAVILIALLPSLIGMAAAFIFGNIVMFVTQFIIAAITIGTWLYTAAAWVARGATLAWAFAWALVQAGMLPVILILAAIVIAGILVYQNWETIKAVGISVFNTLSQVFFSFAYAFTYVWFGIIDAVLSGAEKVGGALGMNVGKIQAIRQEMGSIQADIQSRSMFASPNSQGAGGSTTGNINMNITTPTGSKTETQTSGNFGGFKLNTGVDAG